LSFHNEFLLKKAAKRNDGGQENKTREHEKSSTSSIAYPFKEAQEKREKTKERKNRKKREQKERKLFSFFFLFKKKKMKIVKERKYTISL